MKIYIIILCLIISNTNLILCQIGINSDNSAPHPSAQLDVKSINKGVLFPRMTATERLSILSPEIGLMVFDITFQEIYIFNIDGWKQATLSKLPLSITVDNKYRSIVITNNTNGINGPLNIDGNYATEITHNGDQGTALYAKATGLGGAIIAQSKYGFAGSFISESGNGIDVTAINNIGATILNNSQNWPTARIRNFGGGPSLDISGDILINGKIVSEAPQLPSLQNNWTNVGGFWNTIKYYKSKENRIYLEGTIWQGTDSIIFNLPVGYRPQGRLSFSIISASGFGRVDIFPDGNVQLMSGSMVQISLDGISFRVE